MWTVMKAFRAFVELNPVQLPSGSGVGSVSKAAPRLRSRVFAL